MASITLNWTPVNDANSLSQDVEYQLFGASSWTMFSNVGPAVATETVTGLLDNEIYEFRIVNNCSVGGPVPSGLAESVVLTCPTVTVSSTTTSSINYQFTHLGGDVTSYDIQLRSSSGSTVISTQVKNPPFSSPIAGSFTGLPSGAAYKLRVIPKAQGTVTLFTKTNCALVDASTDEPAACVAPSNLSVTLS